MPPMLTPIENFVAHHFFASTTQLLASRKIIEKTRPYLERMLRKFGFWDFLNDTDYRYFEVTTALLFFSDSVFRTKIENLLYFTSEVSKRSFRFYRCTIDQKRHTTIVFDSGTSKQFEIVLDGWFDYRIEKDNQEECSINLYPSTEDGSRTSLIGDLNFRKNSGGELSVEVKGILPYWGSSNTFNFDREGELIVRHIQMPDVVESTIYRKGFPEMVRTHHTPTGRMNTIKEFDYRGGENVNWVVGNVSPWYVCFGKQVILRPIDLEACEKFTDEERMKFAWEIYGTKKEAWTCGDGRGDL